MAFSTEGESKVIKPDKNMECREDNAAEVIGPVDSGERMIAKNGESREVKAIFWMSKGWSALVMLLDEKYHIPVTVLICRLSSWKFNIRSLSEFPVWPVEGSRVLGRRSPRLLARAESRALSE